MFDTVIIYEPEKDWLDVFAVIAPLVVSIVALWFAWWQGRLQKQQFNEQIKNQNKQWINDVYVKNEAEVLLNLRNLFYENQKAIFWFVLNLLQPKICANFTPKEDDKILPFSLYLENWKKINELNNFYNKNQLICRKYGLEEYFDFLPGLLGSRVCLKEKDFIYIFQTKDERGEIYILNEAGKIKEAFLAHMFLCVQKNADILQIFNRTRGDKEKAINEYICLLQNKTNEIMMKLDEMTVFYDGKIPDSMKIRKMMFFPEPLFGREKQK